MVAGPGAQSRRTAATLIARGVLARETSAWRRAS